MHFDGSANGETIPLHSHCYATGEMRGMKLDMNVCHLLNYIQL